MTKKITKKEIQQTVDNIISPMIDIINKNFFVMIDCTDGVERPIAPNTQMLELFERIVLELNNKSQFISSAAVIVEACGRDSISEMQKYNDIAAVSEKLLSLVKVRFKQFDNAVEQEKRKQSAGNALKMMGIL
ncbi:MAG: hypothetical protein WCG95_00235 [bacterium]